MSTPQSIILSDEQMAVAQHVLDGKGNLIVEALAGTGKTTLCGAVIPLMRGSVAYIVFGKKNSVEAKAKFAALGINNCQVGTFHSFGASAIRSVFKNAKLEGKGAGNAGYKKQDRIFDELKVPEYLQSFVAKAMSLAQQSGFGCDGFVKMGDKQAWLDLVHHHNIDSALGEDNLGVSMKGRQACIEEGCSYAAKAIIMGTKIAHEVYSFTDMLYLVLRLNLPLPTFDNVVVDEAQDSNAARREFARRMHKEG